MYLIEWIDNGETKTFVAEGYWERLAVEERLTFQNIHFITEII